MSRTEGTGLDRLRELVPERRVRTERREDVEDVRPVESPERSERRAECFDLVRSFGRAVPRPDGPRRNPALAQSLPGLHRARERPGELLQAHVQCLVRPVRLLDVPGLHFPGTPTTEADRLARSGAHLPTGSHRQRHPRATADPVPALEGRPLPGTVNVRWERTSRLSVEDEAEAHAREMTSRGEDLLDVPEAAADDRRKEVDIHAPRSGGGFSRRSGRASR